MVRKFKFLVLSLVFAVNFFKFNHEVFAQQPAMEAAKLSEEAKISEYKDLLKQYFKLCEDDLRESEDVLNFSEDDRAQVVVLAEKMREFKKQIEADGVKPEDLDEYVCKKIENEAGNFNVVNKEEFKNLAEQEGQKVLLQGFRKEVAQCLKNGQFKLAKSYNNELRGVNNIFDGKWRLDLNEALTGSDGARNRFGGLDLQCLDDYGGLWWDYARTDQLDFCSDFDESKKLELSVPVGFEILGFALNVDKVKQIDLESLKRYSRLLMLEYPQEFGFVDEILKLKPIIQREMKNHENGEDFRHRKCGCRHFFSLAGMFDFERQCEWATQKEMFGESMLDLELCDVNGDETKKEEIKRKQSELGKKMRCLEYLEKVRENFIKLGKKEHITNINYYLLHNYALLAKLMGYGVVSDFPSKKPGVRHCTVLCGHFVVVDAKEVTVCSERFETEEEAKQIKGIKAELNRD